MNSSFLRIAGVLALVTLVGWGCAKKTNPVSDAGTASGQVNEANSAQNTALATTSQVNANQAAVPVNKALGGLKKTAGGTNEAKTVKSPETYQKALGIYQYRLQFLNCQANPSSLTLKSGMPLMLDNRDSQKRTFKLGKQSFSVLGYDYVIAKAPTPGTYTLICDGGGAAELNVQG